jgi:hypothetical protein
MEWSWTSFSFVALNFFRVPLGLTLFLFCFHLYATWGQQIAPFRLIALIGALVSSFGAVALYITDGEPFTWLAQGMYSLWTILGIGIYSMSFIIPIIWAETANRSSPR